jgi:hypothetical protein
LFIMQLIYCNNLVKFAKYSKKSTDIIDILKIFCILYPNKE